MTRIRWGFLGGSTGFWSGSAGRGTGMCARPRPGPRWCSGGTRLGLPVRTRLWPAVAPADLATTGRAPARHAEVAFAAGTGTGTRDLRVSLPATLWRWT